MYQGESSRRIWYDCILSVLWLDLYGSTVVGVEQQREAGDGESGVVERGESGEGERGDSDKSEDEDVCPICLNELDEGEDLITCRRCVNRLHQHCMDICEWEIETES